MELLFAIIIEFSEIPPALAVGRDRSLAVGRKSSL